LVVRQSIRVKDAHLNSVCTILVRPRFHENVGSVARALKNMGLSRLIIVDGCSPLHPRAYTLASGAEDILERAEEYPSLREATADMGRIIGMTSRQGKERMPLLTPQEMAKEITPLCAGNTIGLAFGSEKEGLTNEELTLCHSLVKIPSAQDFSSLNLAQAVMLVVYELFQCSAKPSGKPVQLIKAEKLERMFDQMEKSLLSIGFLDVQNPKRIMKVLRRLFGRCELQEREVQILHGIWDRMDWQMKRQQVTSRVPESRPPEEEGQGNLPERDDGK
jgi:tRNA/rRNA methyltransferase